MYSQNLYRISNIGNINEIKIFRSLKIHYKKYCTSKKLTYLENGKIICFIFIFEKEK